MYGHNNVLLLLPPGGYCCSLKHESENNRENENNNLEAIAVPPGGFINVELLEEVHLTAFRVLGFCSFPDAPLHNPCPILQKKTQIIILLKKSMKQKQFLLLLLIQHILFWLLPLQGHNSS
jgi:hypothetical protein